jgi:hypothetical protein
MIDSNPHLLPRDFTEINPRFTDPTCNELPWFLAMGLLTLEECGKILDDWDRYESLGWFEGELDSSLRDKLKHLLAEQGFWTHGRFFTDIHNLVFPTYPKRLHFREWYSENLSISPSEVIWGEELGFYEFDNICVSKSVMSNHHLVWEINSHSSELQPFITGGVEFVITFPQITTKADIRERFDIELLCDTVIYSR